MARTLIYTLLSGVLLLVKGQLTSDSILGASNCNHLVDRDYYTIESFCLISVHKSPFLPVGESEAGLAHRLHQLLPLLHLHLASSDLTTGRNVPFLSADAQIQKILQRCIKIDLWPRVLFKENRLLIGGNIQRESVLVLGYLDIGAGLSRSPSPC